MNQQYFDEKAYYEERDRTVPQTARFWGSTTTQQARFDAILRNVPMTATHVLDIGCGIGDFLHYALDYGQAPTAYYGLDIVPKFIAEARQRDLPGGTFAVCNILHESWPVEQVDWVISNGLFGLAQPTPALWWERFRMITEQMWQRATHGIAMTVISTNSSKRDPHTHYAEPAEIFCDLTKRLHWRVRLDHTHLPNDFLLVVCK